MGLDMYLDKRTYIGAEFEHRKVSGTINLKIDGKKVPIDMKKVSSITERVAYWRKANAIHEWFVANVQDDDDNCAEYYVAKEQLDELLTTITQVIASLKESKKKTIQVETGWCKASGTTYADDEVFIDTTMAEDLLPTQSGFFFGSTEYDDYYLEDLEYTKKVLTEIMSEPESWSVSYYYSSSW